MVRSEVKDCNFTASCGRDMLAVRRHARGLNSSLMMEAVITADRNCDRGRNDEEDTGSADPTDTVIEDSADTDEPTATETDSVETAGTSGLGD
jgi:hypothetical protein